MSDNYPESGVGTSVSRQRRCLLTIQSSGRGNVGASVTSLPDNYRESLEQLRTGERRVEVGRGEMTVEVGRGDSRQTEPPTKSSIERDSEFFRGDN